MHSVLYLHVNTLNEFLFEVFISPFFLSLSVNDKKKGPYGGVDCIWPSVLPPKIVAFSPALSQAQQSHLHGYDVRLNGFRSGVRRCAPHHFNVLLHAIPTVCGANSSVASE